MMDIYVLHLAMAALIGALVVAVSVYYMDRKTLAQLLEFAKTMNRDRVRIRNRNRDDPHHNHDLNHEDDDFEDESLIRYPDKRRQGVRRDGGDANGSLYVDDIPPGLPKLNTIPEGNVSNIRLFLCLVLCRFYYFNEM